MDTMRFHITEPALRLRQGSPPLLDIGKVATSRTSTARPSAKSMRVQMEMAQCSYMQETMPFDCLPAGAAGIQPTLDRMLEALRAFAQARRA